MAPFKLTGTLLGPRADGTYAARIPEMEDGVRVKKVHRSARRRACSPGARWLVLVAELEARGLLTANAAAGSDTFAEAPERWHTQREHDGIKSAKTERARVRD